ncbi:MAG TPA: DUF2255 family protein [Acetobacteraceae bacterium]
MSGFNPTTIAAISAQQEIGIRTTRQPDKPVTIWVVVTGDEVFIRSFQAAKGRWYRSVAADGLATLEIDGQQVPVRATPADTAAIDRVSTAFLAKYGSSPYAKEMVRSETLPTTLRVEPR